MEKDFFELYDKLELMCVEVGHSSITDWNVYVYDRRGKQAGDWGPSVVHAEGCDRKLVFAEAYVKLAEYCSEKFGGY